VKQIAQASHRFKHDGQVVRPRHADFARNQAIVTHNFEFCVGVVLAAPVLPMFDSLKRLFRSAAN
jgi:hypothetical protein